MAKHSSLELQLTINTVEGMEILRALDDGPLGVSDLAVRTGVDTFRLNQVARTLVFHGILVRRGAASTRALTFLQADRGQIVRLRPLLASKALRPPPRRGLRELRGGRARRHNFRHTDFNRFR